MLLFMDGFDHYGNGIDMVNSGKWGAHTGNFMTAYTALSRTGTGSAQSFSQSFVCITKPLPASGGFVVGVAFRITVPGGNGIDFLRIGEGGIYHLMLSMANGSSVIQVKNGSGTVLATGTTALTINNWYYLEFKGVIHDTTGSFELRLDGVTEPNCLMAGVDTRNGGTTGQWDRVFLCSLNSSTSYFDDFYVCDQSGALRNDFLGNIKIETLMAQPGNGTNVGLTPSISTDHGALVDEIPANTTDYNSGITAGVKDTYTLPSPVTPGLILGVQTCLFAAKSDAGAKRVCAVYRTGGVDYDGVDQTLLSSFKYVLDIKIQNPGTTVDWTTADLIALEAGMKVTV